MMMMMMMMMLLLIVVVAFLLQYVRTALSLQLLEETVTTSLLCCGFFRTAQTTTLSDPRLVSLGASEGRQFSQSNRHSIIGTRQTEYGIALPSSALPASQGKCLQVMRSICNVRQVSESTGQFLLSMAVLLGCGK